jgi:hypothetical protein
MHWWFSSASWQVQMMGFEPLVDQEFDATEK